MSKVRLPGQSGTLDHLLTPVQTESWTADSANQLSEREKRRLEQLHEFHVLDTPRERLFQSFVEQALKLVPGTTIAAVSLVDLHRQWFKAITGFEVSETPRSDAFCSHTIQTNGVLIVNDATKDSRFADNKFVTGAPGIRFYAGVKLTRAIGTLCVIGTEPREITRPEISKLVQLAQFIDIQLLTKGTLVNLQKTQSADE